MTLTVNRVFRLLLFVLIPNLFTTPLRIFVEAVIEGKEGAPAFVTVPFIIYGICAELVVGLGYLVIGYKLPIYSRDTSEGYKSCSHRRFQQGSQRLSEQY